MILSLKAVKRWGWALSAMVLTGCASSGDVSDPVVRRLTWFSFLSGDDLRSSCAPGMTSLRLVHNAVWDEDVRVIEARRGADGATQAREQLFLRIDWSNVTIGGDAGPLPWRGETFETRWTVEQTAAIIAALGADGAFTPLPAPLQLEGQGFFWTGTGCLNGKPWFHAWAYPSSAYDGLRFPAVLASLLPSGRAFAVAHSVDEAYPNWSRRGDRTFFLTVTADGVSGRPNLPTPPLSRFLP
ncbi:MAG: hypothetical protein JXQ84_09085 [Rhodospirillaceae bacterium]|nr:hypothetical protein [Rhodospirillaceae bacterium]